MPGLLSSGDSSSSLGEVCDALPLLMHLTGLIISFIKSSDEEYPFFLGLGFFSTLFSLSLDLLLSVILEQLLLLLTL
jgi:hypothetical protein